MAFVPSDSWGTPRQQVSMRASVPHNEEARTLVPAPDDPADANLGLERAAPVSRDAA